MNDAGRAIAMIQEAWNHRIEPMGSRVTRSYHDAENAALIAEFGGVCDWRDLSPDFIDTAPDGYGSALSFFSDEAIQYFIAGYLVADLKKLLRRAEPMFAITHGFDTAAYGADGDLDPESIQRWQNLDLSKTAAIVTYLQFDGHGEHNKDLAAAALESYWMPRLRTMQ